MSGGSVVWTFWEGSEPGEEFDQGWDVMMTFATEISVETLAALCNGSSCTHLSHFGRVRGAHRAEDGEHAGGGGHQT